MYDYISVRKDSHYSATVPIAEMSRIAGSIPGIRQAGAVSFNLQLEQACVHIRGIQADQQGNYAYQSDSCFTDINLIEIDLPQSLDPGLENQILELALIFARALNWQVEDHETGATWPENQETV